MDPTSTVWIHEHADLDAIHTTCRPGMEATVEQEFGNLPERAVQAQLRQEHDVRARVSAQGSRSSTSTQRARSSGPARSSAEVHRKYSPEESSKVRRKFRLAPRFCSLQA